MINTKHDDDFNDCESDNWNNENDGNDNDNDVDVENSEQWCSE